MGADRRMGRCRLSAYGLSIRCGEIDRMEVDNTYLAFIREVTIL